MIDKPTLRRIVLAAAEDLKAGKEIAIFASVDGESERFHVDLLAAVKRQLEEQRLQVAPR